MRRALVLLASIAGGCAGVERDGSSATSAGGVGGEGGATSSSPSASSGGAGACSADSECAAPLSCCGGTCVDLATDLAHCGACNAACTPFPHAATVCSDAGRCLMGDCFPGFVDCNGDGADGCEIAEADCICAPGQVESCYEAIFGEGVGPCKAGTRECDATGNEWGPCLGQVIPVDEVCNGIDDNCNGTVADEDPDMDGWTACDGDCCESILDCSDPRLVAPGAFEYPGNGIDDDCDPATEDLVLIACDPVPLDTPTTAVELVQAMGLCQWTVSQPATKADLKWGVLSAELLLADGSAGPPANVQVGVLDAYGGWVLPAKGATMAALSTGAARAEGDPGHVYPQDGPQPGESGGFDAGTTTAVPGAWFAANGGSLPMSAACGTCAGPSCSEAHDSVNLSLTVRVPTNASGFQLKYKLYTAEYPERPCQPADDRFLALLQTGIPVCSPNFPLMPCLPPDGNVAMDPTGAHVSVNTATFTECFPATWPMASGCLEGTFALVGTGMGGWNGSVQDGASTAWTQLQAPVIPGETMALELVIWDGTDHELDSLVLLDAFAWQIKQPQPIGP